MERLTVDIQLDHGGQRLDHGLVGGPALEPRPEVGPAHRQPGLAPPRARPVGLLEGAGLAWQGDAVVVPGHLGDGLAAARLADKDDLGALVEGPDHAVGHGLAGPSAVRQGHVDVFWLR